MNCQIAPIRAAICCEECYRHSLLSPGVEPGGDGITYERKQKSQALAYLRHKDSRALSCLAVAGDDVFLAVLLDRQGFTGENLLVGIVPTRARRMGPLDDSVPNYCVAGGTVSL